MKKKKPVVVVNRGSKNFFQWVIRRSRNFFQGVKRGSKYSCQNSTVGKNKLFFKVSKRCKFFSQEVNNFLSEFKRESKYIIRKVKKKTFFRGKKVVKNFFQEVNKTFVRIQKEFFFWGGGSKAGKKTSFMGSKWSQKLFP